VVSPIQVGEVDVRPGSHVWRLSEPEAGRVLVEVKKGKSGRVPASAIVASPVPGPGLDALKEKDACFGETAPGAFVVEHADSERYFSIERCSAHGRRFLRDLCGGIASYERLTLLLDEDDDEPEAVWARYHAMADDWLNVQGRTL
jgi:hypothetical protein